MLTHIQAWLARAGFPTDVAIMPMTTGLGHTSLWRIAAGPADDYVLRVFPPGDDHSAARETLAMRAIRKASLPVPEVVANGEIDGHDVLLMTLAAGTTVAEALEHDPDHVTGIATGLGALLGAINRLPAPAGLAPADAWLDRAGPELAPLRARMQALPNADRLLHLDFHPQNVMVDGEEVTAVIDWTNTLPGPPHIDLGRSRAILHMVRTLPRLSPEIAALMERFETGLVAAHARHHGPDPDPDLTLAWGVGTQCVDFAPQVERPGSWVTAELVAALEAKRDALIAKVAGS